MHKLETTAIEQLGNELFNARTHDRNSIDVRNDSEWANGPRHAGLSWDDWLDIKCPNWLSREQVARHAGVSDSLPTIDAVVAFIARVESWEPSETDLLVDFKRVLHAARTHPRAVPVC